ncbi:AAA family ATPase [Dactylosporangium sp. AC04546]|uniref:caspase, EACC1-associated type n=1 Tax=Dactylosporangium sp. AC04546 TaxID=2862460 RepID=UPI001EDF66F5|nr:AAA family ATPase [Dactylosporangium sp. AC04546]WVK88840.1 AAA family ATPase [Dactylosporangium sp. AC04546]
MTTFHLPSAAAARLAEARAALPPGALELACHAAVPVAVDPTFLNLLRINFFVDPPHDLPWTVEAALLTSPLFRELGGDLYEIDADLRRHLLVSLRGRFGDGRATQVALLLERYCDQPDVWSSHPDLAQAQRLTAVGIIDPPAAIHWLDAAEDDAGTRVDLSREWFVAMRGRLDAQPDPSTDLSTEIAAAIGDLRSSLPLVARDGARRLGELGLLPGADMAGIRRALQASPLDEAASVLHLLNRLETDERDVAVAGRPSLTSLLGLGSPPVFDPARQWGPAVATTVSIPIGANAGGEPVYLNLAPWHGQTSVRGPDGPVRRDLLRTVALALAATNPPDALHLVLIDPRGTRLFDGLEVLPHVVALARGRFTAADERRLVTLVKNRYMHRASVEPRPIVIITDEIDELRFGDELLQTSAPVVSATEQWALLPGSDIELDPTTANAFAHDGRDGGEEFRVATTDDDAWLIASLIAQNRARAPQIWLPTPTSQPTLFELIPEPVLVPDRGLVSVARDSRDGLRGVAGTVEERNGPGYEPYWVDIGMGNVAVVGRPNSGKTDVLLALLLSLALARTPLEVQFVVLDTSGGLSPLAELPHVARFVDGTDEASARAELSIAVGAGQRSDPETVLVVNQWNFGPELDAYLRALVAGGPASRVHLVVSATSWSALDGLGPLETKIETVLADPSTSRIDPERAAEVPRWAPDRGLAADGRAFFVGLVGANRASNQDAATDLAARIAVNWTGPTARELSHNGKQGSTSGSREALVVAVAQYSDPAFAHLRAPAKDAKDMIKVLADERIGGFTVTATLDRPEYEIRRAVDAFLSNRSVDDLVVVYLSCHAVLDARGRLYFAGSDTLKSRLGSTAVESAWLLDRLDECPARRQVLILDCCFSGSFAGTKGDADVELERRMLGHGRGRALLTASRAREYTFEGAPLPGETASRPGFTAAFVEGLRTGKADYDRDGYISVDDAFTYASERMKTGGNPQAPQRWLYGTEGQIILARNPRSRPTSGSIAPPPPDRSGASDSPWERLDPGKVRDAEQLLAERVVDQPVAVRAVADALINAKVGVEFVSGAAPSPRPKAVFFFVGPTGVGKTELAKALTELVFGDEGALRRFDMSEFATEHASERLTGAPPGFVGHDAGGELTNRMLERPFSVLLFDEIEKAHPRILDKFLQILDDGRLTDGRGRTASFAQSIVIFTSNLGTASLPPHADTRPYEELQRHFLDEVEEHFSRQLGRPELLARLGGGIVVFDVMRERAVRSITAKFLNQIVASARVRGYELIIDKDAVDQAVLDHLATSGVALGARLIRDVLLERWIRMPLNRWILTHAPNPGTRISIHSTPTSPPFAVDFSQTDGE